MASISVFKRYHIQSVPRKHLLAVLYITARYFTTLSRLSVLALPAQIIPRASPSTSNSDGADDRSGVFQVLADGTQDLAALVGIFATDSVERYAVDYARGYLSVAVSTCSLLGMLGYVRALFKLYLGPKPCEKAAFPTVPIRCMFGVAAADRLTKEELITVNYIRRRTEGGEYVFEVVKEVNHTEESFPMMKTLVQHKFSTGSVTIYSANSRIKHLYHADEKAKAGSAYIKNPRKDKLFLLAIWLTAVATSAATAFPVFLIQKESLSWSKMIASFGLFTALTVSHIIWSTAYIFEQIPADYDLSEKQEEVEFAIARPPNDFNRAAVCNLRAVCGIRLKVYRGITLVCAALLCLGYICQYIVVRQSSTNEAVYWLAVHSCLALFRVLIWILDPTFDNFADPHNFMAMGTVADELPRERGGTSVANYIAMAHFANYKLCDWEEHSPHKPVLRVPAAVTHMMDPFSVLLLNLHLQQKTVTSSRSVHAGPGLKPRTANWTWSMLVQVPIDLDGTSTRSFLAI
ncbi:hypothetical protein BJ508DRAFT_376395 [Ascobolus immersus RN42]|uniref:Uncharacterized protein n=1 Tax=Ascobolus immersus RN42 TaxID=1160509 RepID=A0A3N4IBA6_ASCIM|nr:hypothetical protein BJ508DRAFT_376395 [Ascobolus immersus RN42]